MAEIMLMVGDTPSYKDCDILCAFNDRRIQHVHAQHICNSDSELCEMFREKMCQYKFQRVSKNEIKRITLATEEETIFGNVPIVDPTKPHLGEITMAVQQQISEKKKIKGYLFGAIGSEYYYGGRSDLSPACIGDIWNEIEERTSNLRADHALWPMSLKEKRFYYQISVDDMTNQECADLCEPDIDNSDPDKPIIIKRRKKFVDFHTNTGASSETLIKIMDRDIPVDLRSKFTLSRSSIVEDK